MPGLRKFTAVTLKKGIFLDGTMLLDWFRSVEMALVTRSTVTIRLLDQGGQPTMTWVLANAWPIKITGTDLKATGHAVAVETIVLAHEGVSMSST